MQAWRDAGRPAELHIFANGGHGFGTTHTGNATDAWVALFETWLRGLTLLNSTPVSGS